MAKRLSYLELEQVLTGGYVIFVGSAISMNVYIEGKRKNFLPGVREAKREMILSLAQSFPEDTFSNLASKNGLISFASDKRYESSIEEIKFEDFFWRLEKNVGTDAIEDLIKVLYFCQPNYFNHNHLSIAKLQERKVVNFCVTTNFDNGIENASRSRHVITHEKFNRGEKLHSRTVLKLHGDVIDGGIITTTPELFEREGEDEYSYLLEILSGIPILFLGYSGYGDIDISPQINRLKNNNSILVSCSKSEADIPEFATHYFFSDLFSNDPEKNWLLRLADMPKGFSLSRNREWRDDLEKWAKNNFVESTRKKILDDLLIRKANEINLKISCAQRWEAPKYDWKKIFYSAESFVGVGDHRSALVELNSIDDADISEEIERAELIKLYGYCYWREGDYQKAIEYLEYFRGLPKKGVSKDLYLTGLRMYIDAVRDYLSSKPVSERKLYYEGHNIDRYVDYLLKSFPISDSNLYSQNFVSAYEIKHVIGDKIDKTIILTQLQRSIALSEWPYPAFLSRLLIRLNFLEGIKMHFKTTKQQPRRDIYHNTKHTILAIFDSILLFTPFYFMIGIVNKAFLLLQRILLMRFKLLLIPKWEKEFKLFDKNN